MIKKILIACLSVTLGGCTAVQEDLSPFFYQEKSSQTQYQTVDKFHSKVCVVSHMYPLFRYGDGVNKKAVDLNNWGYGLEDALKERFTTVRNIHPKADCTDCDFVVDPDLNLFMSEDKKSMSGVVQVEIKNFRGHVIDTFVVRSDTVESPEHYTEKIPLLNKNSKEENAALIQGMMIQLVDGVVEHIVSHETLDKIGTSVRLANSDFGLQERNGRQILENKALRIPMVTELNFTRVGVDYFMNTIDKNAIKDGRTVQLLWNSNEFRKKADQGKEFFLTFEPVTIESYRYKENIAKLSYSLIVTQNALGAMNVTPGWIAVDTSSEYAKKRLTALQPGEPLIVYAVAGSNAPYLLLWDWARRETDELRRYAIAYLSGQQAPFSASEREKWESAKRMLARALILQEKEGTSHCYMELPVERIAECLGSVRNEPPRYRATDREIKRKIRELDNRIKKLKAQL